MKVGGRLVVIVGSHRLGSHPRSAKYKRARPKPNSYQFNSEDRYLTAVGLHALRDENTRTVEPARALAAETLKLERTLSDLVNQAYALTPAEIDLLWKTAPPRMPI